MTICCNHPQSLAITRIHPIKEAPMLLQKTEKARLELLPGVRTLSLRERSLLLLVEGKPLSDLQAMYNGIGAQIVDNLMRQGYLTGPKELPHAGSVTAAQGDDLLAGPSGASSAASPASSKSEAGEALRSLAGARMYLFDTCERLFVRRDPVLAQHFREALRAAKDRESMLDVGEAMLEEVSIAAGPERAASLRERLQALLPPVLAEAPGRFATTLPAGLH